MHLHHSCKSIFVFFISGPRQYNVCQRLDTRSGRGLGKKREERVKALFKIVDVKGAVSAIKDGATVGITGFMGSACPEYLLKGIEDSFLEGGHPCALTMTHSPGIGDGKDRGMNHMAHAGLLKRVIASHYNLAPLLQAKVDSGEIEAYLLPQGTLCQLYREIGAGRPGVITKTGLGTFVDPRLEGGKCNALATRELVEVVTLGGEEYLWYKSFPIDVAIIRGTSVDEHGNVSAEKETTLIDQLALAQAARRSGGIVIVQAERVVAAGAINPRDVIVPGILVDYVVLSPAEYHYQNFGNQPYDAALAHEFRIPVDSIPILPMSDRKIIARRAAMELPRNAVINLGIGIPEGVSGVAVEEGFADQLTMTVEAGQIGGVPAAGAAFGGAYNPEFVPGMINQFDFYDGGGLDVCFLGAAEVDAMGNCNVSKFTRTVGPGGFINIASNTPKCVFCGTLTAGGLKTEVKDGRLVILQEGRNRKYVKQVKQVTFSGANAVKSGQKVLFITERAVFELDEEGIILTEIAPGIDLQTQVLDVVDFDVRVSSGLRTMDERIFREGKMGLEL